MAHRCKWYDREKSKMSLKKIQKTILLLGIVVLILLWDAPFENRESKKTVDSCAVYYLLNIDGMKGLGHTALLLTDERGNGQVYSYNGMQYSLIECLQGKAGVGKMKVFTLSVENVSDFFATGDLEVEDTAECDNFDRMFYRYISRTDYERIRECAVKYIDTGTIFESLYAAVHSTDGEERITAEERLNDFLNQENLPRYQIYTHNCDTVARELIAEIDEEMRIYNAENAKLTPAGNYIGMCRKFSELWGCQTIGEDTLLERVFWR